jgi:hypothetical protein
MGYRMGGGEAYWQEFTDWFRSLAPDARARFVAENPEPADWRYFYEYICLVRNDESGHARLYPLIVANQRAYQATEYERGRVAEENGELSVALRHYGNANQHGDFQDVAERYERLRRALRGEAEPGAAADGGGRSAFRDV